MNGTSDLLHLLDLPRGGGGLLIRSLHYMGSMDHPREKPLLPYHDHSTFVKHT